MPTGRLADRVRGRVVGGDGDAHETPAGVRWDDVLLCRYIDDGATRVDVWGRAVHFPQLQAEHTHPDDARFVFVASLHGADVLPMPHKGQQRRLVLDDGVELVVHVGRNCCSSPFRDFWP